MPRVPRSQLLGNTSYLHVICRGNNRVALFHEEEDFHAFRSRLRCYSSPSTVAIYHYILMTTHVHLVVHAQSVSSLSRLLQRTLLSYCHYFQRKYPSVGHLWHNRFRSVPIESEAHYLRCGRYVELNSAAAGMVEQPGDYPWSSYHVYALGERDALVTVSPFYLQMGDVPKERQAAYRAFIAEGLTCDRESEKTLFEPRGIQLSEKRPRRPRWCTL